MLIHRSRHSFQAYIFQIEQDQQWSVMNEYASGECAETPAIEQLAPPLSSAQVYRKDRETRLSRSSFGLFDHGQDMVPPASIYGYREGSYHNNKTLRQTT